MVRTWQGAVARLGPVVSLVGGFYVAVLLWLAVWAAATWLMLGWAPTVVTTDDLRPGLRPGDLVMVGEAHDGPLAEGSVIRMEHPVQAGRMVLSRVGDATERSTYLTTSNVEVTREEVTGVGRLLVPAIGMPVVWLREGRFDLLLLALIPTVLACLLTARPVIALFRQDEPRRRPSKRLRWTSELS